MDTGVVEYWPSASLSHGHASYKGTGSRTTLDDLAYTPDRSGPPPSAVASATCRVKCFLSSSRRSQQILVAGGDGGGGVLMVAATQRGSIRGGEGSLCGEQKRMQVPDFFSFNGSEPNSTVDRTDIQKASQCPTHRDWETPTCTHAHAEGKRSTDLPTCPQVGPATTTRRWTRSAPNPRSLVLFRDSCPPYKDPWYWKVVQELERLYENI
jgi:hypothetical protein